MTLVEQLDRLSHPVFQAALIAALGTLCLCLRRNRSGAGLLAAAFLWLWLCCTPAFALWLQRGLESQYPPQPAASYARADAIVVLGGGVVPGSKINWRADEADVRTTRTGFGLQLYQDGRAPIILLSGGDGEAEQMAEALRQQGVPASALRTEQVSMTTHENALYSTTILKRENRHRVLLVTSAMHMPRAAASFRQQGLSVIPAPALNPTLHPQEMPRRWWPARTALTQSKHCLREYLGLWGYRLRGWA